MKLLSRAEDAALALILWSLFFVVGLQFFTRYVLNNSLGWTEEIARMLLIVMTYVGAVVCARKSSHIQVDLLVSGFGSKTRRLIEQLTALLSAAVYLFLAFTAIKFALQTRMMLSSIEIPKSIIYCICSVSLVLMAFHQLVQIFQAKLATDLRESEHGDT